MVGGAKPRASEKHYWIFGVYERELVRSGDGFGGQCKGASKDLRIFSFHFYHYFVLLTKFLKLTF